MFDKLRHDCRSNIDKGERGVIEHSKCFRSSPFVNDCSSNISVKTTWRRLLQTTKQTKAQTRYSYTINKQD